jgi:chromatin remodeling complex protein RSC6
MARQAKATSTTSKTTTADDSTPIVAKVATPTPAVSVEAASSTPKVKKVAVKKEKTTPAAVAATPVVAAPVAASAAVEEVAVDAAVEETPLADRSADFLAKLQQLSVVISALKVEYRTLEKNWTRELKNSMKQSSKRKRKSGNRAPSGFVKPTRISDELAKFLDKPSGSEMARTEVTRDINQYIRANNLQDKENGRKIIPDTKLAGLLKLKKGEELTYFNLQRYMSPHFAKSDKSVAAAAAAAAQSTA